MPGKDRTNELAMEAICAPIRAASTPEQREKLARRMVRYAVIVLAAQIGVKATAQHLSSLAGQMFDEVD